jgi:hypothetical protein
MNKQELNKYNVTITKTSEYRKVAYSAYGAEAYSSSVDCWNVFYKDLLVSGGAVQGNNYSTGYARLSLKREAVAVAKGFIDAINNQVRNPYNREKEEFYCYAEGVKKWGAMK